MFNRLIQGMKLPSRSFYWLFVFCAWVPAGCTTETMSPQGGDLTVAESQIITVSSSIGNLTVKGNAVLTIDYTSTQQKTLIVNGSVILQDNAQLIVRGNKTLMNDGFIIANDYSSHRTIKTTGNSMIKLEDVVIRTQTGTAEENGSVYMSYDAYDNSSFVIDGAALDNESSWLLGNFRDHSVLQAHNSVHVPTEIYLNDYCSVSIDGSQTSTGVWMSLTSGPHTISLPDVSIDSWNWNAGSDIGSAVHWTLSVTNSNPGLGVLLFQDASATITGHGGSTKELTIGYFVSSNDETLDNLHVGLQNGEIVPGRLTLNTVNLGPIAWQVYSLTSASLTINNSTINEIGIFGDGDVTVNNSVLQLAVLASYGQHSLLALNNCDIWNQSIESDNGGVIALTNCNVYGCLFRAKQAQSSISINGGTFYDNPPPDRTKPMIDLISGYPNYNPFRAPGPPKRSGLGAITCIGVQNCSW